MTNPVVLLAQAAAETGAGPDGYETALGGIAFALVGVAGWVIASVRGIERYQGLASKVDAAAERWMTSRGMSNTDLANMSTEQLLAFQTKLKER